MNCLPLPSAVPLIVANWPMRARLAEHSTLNFFVSDGRAEAIHDSDTHEASASRRRNWRCAAHRPKAALDFAIAMLNLPV